jgi:predicted transcriptional regulator of viral defense system/very-short-patch-repair endonuclease
VTRATDAPTVRRFVTWVTSEADVQCSFTAGRQFGLITREQALEAGMSQKMVRNRLATGWHRILPGVLALPGAPESWEQRMMAACLWCRSTGVAGGRSAGAIHGLHGLSRDVIELVTTSKRKPPHGVIVHVTRDLLPADTRVINGIPVTNVDRTLVDLASLIDRDKLAIALDDALRRRLTHVTRLQRRLDCMGTVGRKGAGILAKLLVERNGLDTFPESALETGFYEFICRWKLPRPRLQERMKDERGRVVRVDFFYPSARLVIELESFAWHSGRDAWERDLRRRNQMETTGLTVLHYTPRDLGRRQGEMAREIRGLLAAG